jgi:hypothetical protein
MVGELRSGLAQAGGTRGRLVEAGGRRAAASQVLRAMKLGW